jgi:hypothetical protein
MTGYLLHVLHKQKELCIMHCMSSDPDMAIDPHAELMERSHLEPLHEGVLHRWDRHQWLHGALPSSELSLLKIAGLEAQSIALVRELLQRYYNTNDKGEFVHPRLHLAREAALKRKAVFTNRARNAANVRHAKEPIILK